MITTVIFDLDNTLVETQELIYQSYEHTLQLHGLKKPTREEILSYMGPPAVTVYERLAPQFDNEELFETHRQFTKNNLHLVTLYTHTMYTLQVLKNSCKKIGIVTARSKASTQDILRATGIFDFFDCVVASDDVSKPKPHPEHVLKALELLNTKPQNGIMVGDTHTDIQAGKAAGVKTIGVTYGFHGEKIKEAGPDHIIADIKEVPFYC